MWRENGDDYARGLVSILFIREVLRAIARVHITSTCGPIGNSSDETIGANNRSPTNKLANRLKN